FFFQAEDGIRDKLVTGVQTCALPISPSAASARHRSARPDTPARSARRSTETRFLHSFRAPIDPAPARVAVSLCDRAGAGVRMSRSEERRVGKECRGGCAG